MTPVDENKLSQFLRNLLKDAGEAVSGQVQLRVHDGSLFNVALQTVVQENGDYVLHVREESLADEYAISHELLHICAKKHIPSFVRVIEPNLISVIGTKLQGYLEHNWILAEQKRRGLKIDELQLFPDLESEVGAEEEGLEKNINRILTINNLLRTFPAVLTKHKTFVEENCPRSLAISQRIMAHFPAKEIYSNYEARKAIVSAIKEWNKIFQENGFNSINLSQTLSVTPVFSANQLQRQANANLGLASYAIINNKSKTANHILYTLNDDQCCMVFAMDNDGLNMLRNYMKKMTLEEFLRKAKISYLLRLV
ncbi:MAG: hypothetical protein RO469_14280 [Thermincola sp.]|jgi:hypothetical protein|nr:hypothetical protein [Thermincola sp.]MDT3703862.1 hypothetical protein [Thermincola sp.]